MQAPHTACSDVLQGTLMHMHCVCAFVPCVCMCFFVPITLSAVPACFVMLSVPACLPAQDGHVSREELAHMLREASKEYSHFEEHAKYMEDKTRK